MDGIFSKRKEGRGRDRDTIPSRPASHRPACPRERAEDVQAEVPPRRRQCVCGTQRRAEQSADTPNTHSAQPEEGKRRMAGMALWRRCEALLLVMSSALVGDIASFSGMMLLMVNSCAD